MKINAKIRYTCDADHPDRKYMTDWTEDKIFEFSDSYTIDKNSFYGDDDINAYIKNDLLLIAGGGYNSDHIHNVSFDLKRV